MSDAQLAQLTTYLDEHFDLLTQRMDFNEQYMMRRFDQIEARMDERFSGVQVQFNQIHNVLDGVVGDIQDIKIELGAIHVQLDRHDRAIRGLAHHTDMRLSDEWK